MQSVNEIWPVYAILQNIFLIKKFYKKFYKLVPGPF